VSFALDVNVLLYASDQASPFHGGALRFLKKVSEGREAFYLTWPTVMSYLRIATHPGVFEVPLSPEEAAENVEQLLALPHVRVLGERDEFWKAWREATEGLVVRGNLVPDAHVSAILLQHGVKVLYTNDRDFSRFPFLEPRNPF